MKLLPRSVFWKIGPMQPPLILKVQQIECENADNKGKVIDFLNE